MTGAFDTLNATRIAFALTWARSTNIPILSYWSHLYNRGEYEQESAKAVHLLDNLHAEWSQANFLTLGTSAIHTGTQSAIDRIDTFVSRRVTDFIVASVR